jgi:hypothetical protein
MTVGGRVVSSRIKRSGFVLRVRSRPCDPFGNAKITVSATAQSLAVLSLLLVTSDIVVTPDITQARVASGTYAPTIHCSWAIASDQILKEDLKSVRANELARSATSEELDQRSERSTRTPQDSEGREGRKGPESSNVEVQNVCSGDRVRQGSGSRKGLVMANIRYANSLRLTASNTAVSSQTALSNSSSVQLLSAVSYPVRDAFGSDAFGNKLGTVSWTIRKPDGEVLAQVNNPRRSCGGTNEPGPMWAAAIGRQSEYSDDISSGSGAFSMETGTNDPGIDLWRACRQGRIRMFVGQVSIPTNDQCGNYSVSNSASVDGEITTTNYLINVECPVVVGLDTHDVHWAVDPGGTAVVEGDLNPGTIEHPTITNYGKDPIQVGVVFSALRHLDFTDSIAEFGVMLIPKVGAAAGISRLQADIDGWITGPSAIVCPGESVRVNLVVHAPTLLRAGNYSGNVRVIARAGGQC